MSFAGAEENDEVKKRCLSLRAELTAWVESHMEDFLAIMGAPLPELPVIEDFRLLICVTDGANTDASCFYPVVSSGTSYHRQIGLLDQGREYLTEYFADE